ncbi:hypothetical protein BSKO_04268 [Bryopsis sp. KO-2023]|nr:hypothetical protein BSKO_04268 [Bryopsis sp. KO-2023]
MPLDLRPFFRDGVPVDVHSESPLLDSTSAEHGVVMTTGSNPSIHRVSETERTCCPAGFSARDGAEGIDFSDVERIGFSIPPAEGCFLPPFFFRERALIAPESRKSPGTRLGSMTPGGKPRAMASFTNAAYWLEPDP